MAKALMRNDLSGQRFGRLVARCVDESRTGNGKVYWRCDCDCGNETSVQSTALTRKHGTKSCGCARNSTEAKIKARNTHNSYPEDITGFVFGRLTVVRKTDMKSIRAADNGSYLWECTCECGELCYYSRYSLLTPNGIRSCGCLYEDSRYEIGKKYNMYDLDNYDFGIGYCNNNTYFFFDKEDYDKIKNYCWWYDGRYVIAHTLENDEYTTATIKFHRVVMDIEDREDIEVDHKNLIRYDCRKSNLRRATTIENSRNKDYSNCSSTGIVGVRKENDKWLATIKNNKKNVRLGLFDTFEEAVDTRIKAEIELFGEFRFDMSNKDIIDENNMSQYRKYKEAI